MATLREAMHKDLLAQAATMREAARLAEAARLVEKKQRAEAKEQFLAWLEETKGIELPSSARVEMRGEEGCYGVLVSFNGDMARVESNLPFIKDGKREDLTMLHFWRGKTRDARDGDWYYVDCSDFITAAIYALEVTLADFEEEDEQIEHVRGVVESELWEAINDPD